MSPLTAFSVGFLLGVGAVLTLGATVVYWLHGMGDANSELDIEVGDRLSV